MTQFPRVRGLVRFQNVVPIRQAINALQQEVGTAWDWPGGARWARGQQSWRWTLLRARIPP